MRRKQPKAKRPHKIKKEKRKPPNFSAGTVIERRCFIADEDNVLWLVDPEVGKIYIPG